MSHEAQRNIDKEGVGHLGDACPFFFTEQARFFKL